MRQIFYPKKKTELYHFSSLKRHDSSNTKDLLGYLSGTDLDRSRLVFGFLVQHEPNVMLSAVLNPNYFYKYRGFFLV